MAQIRQQTREVKKTQPIATPLSTQRKIIGKVIFGIYTGSKQTRCQVYKMDPQDFSDPAASLGEEILAANNVKVSLKYKMASSGVAGTKN